MARPTQLSKSIKPISVIDPPHPAPDHLNESQSEIWNALVERMGNEWFPVETHDLLAIYCQHVINGRIQSELINELMNDGTDHLDPLWLSTYDRLCKMLDRENRAASSAATRLRITNQSLRLPDAKKPPVVPGGGSKPWQ